MDPAPSIPQPAPVTARGRATRDRILAAATGLMYVGGVAETSMDDVKVAAGVSSSQLYHYFADREALISAVVARQGDTVLAVQEPLLAAIDDLAGLRAWRDAVVAMTDPAETTFAGCPIGSLVGELAETGPIHRAELAAAMARWQAAITSGLERMRARGALAPEADPSELALGLLAALQGGLLLAQVQRSTAAVAAALDLAIARIAALAPSA